MNRELRSQVISFYLLDVQYREIEEGEADFAERKLPRGTSIIGRILNLTKRKKGKKSHAVSEICNQVGQEIHDMWVYTGNVYPKCVKNISNMIAKE